MRQLRAFLLSPLPAAILGSIVSYASGGYPRPVSLAIFYLLLLYAAQLLFGVAIRAFLLKANRVYATDFALGGIAMTGMPSAPYLAWAVTKNPGAASSAVFALVLALMLGAVTGLSYWLVARPVAKEATVA